MKQDYFILRLDGLIFAIETVLTKNRSSLSITDVALLEYVLISLEELKKVKVVDREEMLTKLLPTVLNFFLKPEVMEQVTEVLNNLMNF